MAGLQNWLTKMPRDATGRWEKGSLQRRLAVALASAIVAVAVAAGIFSFTSAFEEANELQDDVLRQIASLVGSWPAAGTEAAATVDRPSAPAEDSTVSIQWLAPTPAPHPANGGRAAIAWPEGLKDGLQTVVAGGKTYRVMVQSQRGGNRLAVAQETAVRDEIARDGALRTLMPFVILVPILLLVAADLIRRIVKPIADVSAEIDARGQDDLHAIASDRLPVEVRPFVAAINRLLTRIDEGMAAQRRFIADAAHELRSPLTALSLQAERLTASPMPDATSERLASLRQGIERGRALLEQLLSLARAQAAQKPTASDVSVLMVYRRVLEDLLPLAEVKHIDIGITDGPDACVRASELDLMTVVRNLVDNAIRYTPANGRVDLAVRLDAGTAVLSVRDNGPGIAPAEHERVFDAFYRVLGTDEQGSGLGLTIVRTIAARMGASLALGVGDTASGQGLMVTLRIPPAPR